jgi:hypothetical protein
VRQDRRALELSPVLRPRLYFVLALGEAPEEPGRRQLVERRLGALEEELRQPRRAQASAADDVEEMTFSGPLDLQVRMCVII